MDRYYLGVDVSKGYSDFVILDAQKQPVVMNFQIDDTFEGHCVLYKKLCSFFDDHPDSVLYAGIESTGGYENNWVNSLIKFQGTLNLKTTRLNPYMLCHHSKADMNRIITDKISAQNVAEYLITHPEKVAYQEHDYLSSLRKQWGFIKILTKQKTQLLNQLESLLYNAQPELLVYCKNGVPSWIFKLLTRYPTAAKLGRTQATTVARIPYITISRAYELITNAKKSVASSTDEITGQLIMATVKQIVHLARLIEVQSAQLTAHCSVPEVDILKTFDGINDFSAVGLLLEIQTVHRFPNVKNLSSFFGVHPVFKVSGDGCSGFRMSKQGRKEPRQILFMVAMTAINHNLLIKEIYEKHVEQGMAKMAAIGLCMHKILRIIYGMLKHNRAFDSEIDRRNQRKTLSRRKKVFQDKNRRYQAFDPRAPISRRQAMQRKEREESHSVNGTKSGIITSVPLSV